MNFKEICDRVENVFAQGFREAGEMERARLLEHEKKAIMGFEEDMNTYIEKIRGIIREEFAEQIVAAENSCPPWYPELAWGVFHQLYGLAGLAPWAYDTTEEYGKSSSAKLIGERLYCLIDGVSVLQPQKIDAARREQLKRALLLSTPRERLEKGYHEVYLRNGIRITIYAGNKTKEGQDIMVFRKYLLEELTFEKLAELGTIPSESVCLFKAMVAVGFNIVIAGPVRSGKTTFLQVWQKCESPLFEGLCISTDP